jgi:exodeoxyribonuclease VII small subunit
LTKRTRLRWVAALKIALPLLGNFCFMATTATPKSAAPASYEAAMQEVDQLLSQLESGDMPLEQMLKGYQRGAELIKFCRERLEAVEYQIKVLDQGTLKTWTPD